MAANMKDIYDNMDFNSANDNTRDHKILAKLEPRDHPLYVGHYYFVVAAGWLLWIWMGIFPSVNSRNAMV